MANEKLQIEKIDNGNSRTVMLTGTLDKINSTVFESQLLATTENVTELILDCGSLVYITSAGLRVLLKMQLEMETKGSMIIVNAGEMIMEVFSVTGFTDFLNIQ